MKTRVEAVLTGTSDGLIENGVQSAIVKRAVHGACWLACDGLTGDQQADRTAHGGFERALSHYPAEHYAQWRAQYVDRAEAFEIGALGENIATYGLTEADVCVGDMFYLGTATLQVAQPRQPCWNPPAELACPTSPEPWPSRDVPAGSIVSSRPAGLCRGTRSGASSAVTVH